MTKTNQKGIFSTIYIRQNEKNKWHPKVKTVYDYNPKRYVKIVEVQIVQQQRSTLEQLEHASSSVTFRDQRWAYHLLPSHVLCKNWTTAHPSIFIACSFGGNEATLILSLCLVINESDCFALSFQNCSWHIVWEMLNMKITAILV